MLGVRASSAQALADNLLEGEAEVPTEQGVDARINGGIAVAQPEEDGKEDRRDALRTERPYHVHREERHPANDETADNDALIILTFHSLTNQGCTG